MMKLIKKFNFLVLALLLLLCVGLISALPPLRLDLTHDKLYTLSDGTLNLLGKLEGEPLHVTLFYSDKVTQNIPTIRAYSHRVKEMLHEYQLHSHGKIKLDIIDPEPFSEAEDRAAALGLQGVPTSNKDTIYFGLVVEKGDKREIIPFFNSEKEASLEYDISQAIYRINQPKHLVVGVISDIPIFQHRNMSSPQTIKPKVILEQLRQMFDIKRMYDNHVEKIDDEIDLLMVVQPHLWPESTLYAIDQFVLRGGRLLVFMDPNAEMDESEKDLFGGDAFQDKSSSLEQLLPAWGVQFDPKKIVLDYQFAHSIPVTRYGQALPHVGVLGIRDAGFNRTEAMTASVDQVNVATAGALIPIPGASTHFTMLMQSSAESELMDTEEYNKIPNHELLLQKFKADGHGPYTLAAYITGPAKTAFPNGKPVVPDESKNASKNTKKTVKKAAPDKEAVTDKQDAQLLQSKQDISVVLFADTDILDDRMWVQVEEFYGQPVATPWASNSDLIVNVLEKLSGSVDLIHVRGRGSYNRPFERVNALEREASEKFRDEQEKLQAKLTETEQHLKALTDANGDDSGAPSEPNAEQKAEIEKFQQERLQIRKKLREVQHNLNEDIDHLGSVLKVINILAVPVLIIIAALGAIFIRRKRTTKSPDTKSRDTRG